MSKLHGDASVQVVDFIVCQLFFINSRYRFANILR